MFKNRFLICLLFCGLILGKLHAQDFKISGGSFHTVALSSDGKVYTWGSNSNYQLGRSPELDQALSPEEVPIDMLPTIRAVEASSGAHVLALACDSTVWTWGANEKGQLGNNVLEIEGVACGPGMGTNRGNCDTYVPSQVVGGETGKNLLTSIVKVAASTSTSYAINEDGYLLAWGANEKGQLGIGTAVPKQTASPVFVLNAFGSPLTNVIDIAATDYGCFALVDEDGDGVGTVYGWGYNSNKTFGTVGSTVLLPVAITDINNQPLTNITALAGGDTHGLFIDADGYLWAIGGVWGGGNQLGTVDATYSPNQGVAEKVLAGEQTTLEGFESNIYLSNVTSVSAGQAHTVASVFCNGKSYAMAWGTNEIDPWRGGTAYGLLGNGTDVSANVPQFVLDVYGNPVEKVTYVSTGDFCTYIAVKGDFEVDGARIFSCGANYYGQLGTGTTTNELYPAEFYNPEITYAEKCPSANLGANTINICKKELSAQGLILSPKVFGKYEFTWNAEIDGVAVSLDQAGASVNGIKGEKLLVTKPGVYSVAVATFGPYEQTCTECPIASGTFTVIAEDLDFTISTSSICGETVRINATTKSENTFAFFSTETGTEALVTSTADNGKIQVTLPASGLSSVVSNDASYKRVWVEDVTSKTTVISPDDLSTCSTTSGRLGDAMQQFTVSGAKTVLESVQIKMKSVYSPAAVYPVIYGSTTDVRGDVVPDKENVIFTGNELMVTESAVYEIPVGAEFVTDKSQSYWLAIVSDESYPPFAESYRCNIYPLSQDGVSIDASFNGWERSGDYGVAFNWNFSVKTGMSCGRTAVDILEECTACAPAEIDMTVLGSNVCNGSDAILETSITVNQTGVEHSVYWYKGEYGVNTIDFPGSFDEQTGIVDGGDVKQITIPAGQNGMYTAIVIDKNKPSERGCWDAATVEVLEAEAVTYSITGGGNYYLYDPVNPVSISVSGVAPFIVEYELNRVPQSFTSEKDSIVLPLFDLMQPGNYEYKLVSISDANGCEAVIDLGNMFIEYIYTAPVTIHIPDENLLAALVANPRIDINGSGDIQEHEAAAFNGGLELNKLGIKDMTGIEYFTSLTSLKCGENEIDALDISTLTNLQLLYCYDNNLSSLDVSANVALKQLSCYSNSLESLDVSANSKLQSLNFVSNNISEIDLSNNDSLVGIYCVNNDLTYLDLSANKEIEFINCGRNKLKTIDLRNCDVLNIKFFDIANNPDLYCINVDNYSDVMFSPAFMNYMNSITFSEDCSTLVKTTIVVVDANGAVVSAKVQLSSPYKLTNTQGRVSFYKEPDVYSFTISATGYYDEKGTIEVGSEENTIIVTLKPIEQDQIVHIPDPIFKAALVNNTFINANGDDEIQRSEAMVVTALNVADLGIEDLTGIEAFTALHTLDCSDNILSSLDVRNNTLLKTLTCTSNLLEELKLAKSDVLESVRCNDNMLTELDFTGCFGIMGIYCEDNNLTSLSIDDCHEIRGLYCRNNNLETLNIDNAYTIMGLDCSNNDIADIDVTNKLELRSFKCDGNPMKTVDVSGCINLYGLTINDSEVERVNVEGCINMYNVNIENCNVSYLNLTGCDNMISINAANNFLEEINLAGLNNMRYVDFNNNKLKNLDISDCAVLTVVKCSNNELENITVGAPELKQLICDNNNLTSLDMSSVLMFASLDCSNNMITELDFSQNGNLFDLNLSENNLSVLNLQNANNQQLSKVDLTTNPNLYCVAVSDIEYANETWTTIDPQIGFSSGCAPLYNAVIEIVSNETPVAGITVEINGKQFTSDENGIVNLDYVFAATYSYIIHAEGYISTEGNFNVTESASIQIAIEEILPYEVEISETACGSYIFGDDVLTESGVYVTTFVAEDGNDEIVTLNLVVNPIYDITENVTITFREEYQFGNTMLTENGTYTQTFVSGAGCDSIVTVIVDVVAPEGQPFVIGGETTETAVDENSAEGTIIASLPHVDANGNSLVYEINGTDAFAVVDDAIVVADPSVLDFEKNGVLSFVVFVSKGAEQLYAPVVVTVNDINEAPVFELEQMFVDQKADNKTEITKLPAIDIDGDELIYSLNDESVVEVKGRKIVVANAEALSTMSGSIDLVLTITDGEFIVIRDIAITIIPEENMAPEFADQQIEFTVQTENGPATIVTTLSALDLNNDALEFTINSVQNEDGDEVDGVFTVDRESGIIFYDRENDDEYEGDYTIAVSVSDGYSRDELDLNVSLAQKATDVEDLSATIAVYPTVVKDELTVTSSENATVTVTTLEGKSILVEQFSGEYKIDSFIMTAGTYIVTVVTDSGVTFSQAVFVK